MRKLFDFAARTGFKAPLVSINDEFDLKHFARLCDALNISQTAQAIGTSVYFELVKLDEHMASIKHVSNNLDKTPSLVRRNLEILEKAGLVSSEFVTTDSEKSRRGKLFSLTIPNSNTLEIEQSEKSSVDDFKLVSQERVNEINLNIMDLDWRLITTLVTQLLVKAMRTNVQDKSQEKEIRIPVRDGSLISLRSVSELDRLMHVKDIAYYSGAITWLYHHIQRLIGQGGDISETYILPLDKIVSLGKNISVSEASSGGYIENAIQAMKRTSGTSFELNDLPGSIKQFHSNAKAEFYSLKLFRLEAVVAYEEGGSVKKAVQLQFPKSTIDAMVFAIKENTPSSNFMLIDEELFNNRNEIEILFGLWAREQFTSQPSFDRQYSWNEVREIVAPSTPLDEFKRKFSNMIRDNADPQYNAKIPDAVEHLITNKKTVADDDGNENVILAMTGKGVNQHVLFGRATVQGFLINVGYSTEEKATKLFFRKDLTALAFSRKAIRKILN
jgi:predicted transcriptional regulator